MQKNYTELDMAIRHVTVFCYTSNCFLMFLMGWMRASKKLTFSNSLEKNYTELSGNQKWNLFLVSGTRFRSILEVPLPSSGAPDNMVQWATVLSRALSQAFEP